ncbi:MAG TPA: phosphoglycerate dehydrogenase [Candidatus Hydrogenedentes bacterium]|nr:phosphoglycerate dehydrogenase [Candidatus Hydrogenedentota bacterium]HPG69061.1 phosphoglycerate dehydrogenase [Candidatus Hydrogenedentota bacterium]
MPKILALDHLSEEGLAIFRQAEGFDLDIRPPQSPEELAAIIADYDGLVVRSATKVTAEVFRNAKRLKVIGRAGVGTDNIDKDAATKRGIVVMNTPGGNTISTCEHAFALLFALCRNIPCAHQSMAEGRWDRKKFMGAEVFGKTLGIVGVGRIGSAVAKRAQAFEMKVIAFDPLLTRLKADALGVELVTFEELLERSDIITIHAPKSERTHDMIRSEHFRMMKPTCRIVNCARGGIVNEGDLADALREKVIAGAALDVFTSEPFANNPFIGLPNIVMTPHLAASTDEAQLTVAIDVAKQMVDFLSTGAIVNAVNVPSIDAETRRALDPILYLGERLGRFQALYTEGRPTNIKIEYRGDLAVTDTYPITAGILTGYLAPMVEMVNTISAPSVLEEHGIEFSEKRGAAATDYAFEISVTVITDRETHRVSGTLFSRKDPRICSIDGFRMDARPEGHMLVCMNEDKPLIIGRVGTVIGEAGVNIANMVLGRDKAGGRAATILNLDSPLSDALLDRIRSMPHILEARLVSF